MNETTPHTEIDSPVITPITDAATSDIPRYSYYALAVLTLVNLLNYVDRQVLPSVAYYMSQDPQLRLTDSEIGYMETALLLSFTVFAPLFGRLGDRYPRAKLMASAAVIWSFATALTGISDRFAFIPGLNFNVPIVHWAITMSGAALALCLVRAIVGVGESAYSTITPSLIADYFPPQRRATALGIFQAAIPLGFALGFVIGGILAKFFGWRIAFMTVSVPGLITAVIVWRLKEPRRGATDLHETKATALAESKTTSMEITQATEDAASSLSFNESSWHTAWRILSTRDWLLSTAGYTALTFVLGAFATWATLLLIRDKGMSETSAPIALGVIILLGGALGTFGGGWVADRVSAGKSRRYFVLCALGTFLGIIPTLVALSASNHYIYLPAIFIAVTLLFVNNAPFHALLLQSVPAHVRAMAVALNIVVIHTFGDAISRSAVGILSDALKAGRFNALVALANLLGIDASRQHLSTALLISPVALSISTLIFLWGAKTTKR